MQRIIVRAATLQGWHYITMTWSWWWECHHYGKVGYLYIFIFFISASSLFSAVSLCYHKLSAGFAKCAFTSNFAQMESLVLKRKNVNMLSHGNGRAAVNIKYKILLQEKRSKKNVKNDFLTSYLVTLMGFSFHFCNRPFYFYWDKNMRQRLKISL